MGFQDGERKKGKLAWLGTALVAFGVASLAGALAMRWPATWPGQGNPGPIITAASSTQVWIMAAAPLAAQDRIFVLSLPENTLEERAAKSGWRIQSEPPSRLTIVREETRDGVWTLQGTGWSVALRNHRGQAYQDPTLLGSFDRNHEGVIARMRDGQILLSVSRAGEVQELTQLPESYTSFGIHAHAFWLASFQQGEGLESPPMGPSMLLRVDADGATSTVAIEQQVINSLALDPMGNIAYGFENGTFHLQEAYSAWGGQGRPLLWTGDHHLLMARENDLFLVDSSTQAITFVAHLPTIPESASLSPVL